MYSNIRGIKSKKASLIEILEDINPHLCLLTETQMRTNTGFNIKGYTFFGRKREGKVGGGVGILARNDKVHLLTPHINDRNIEIMWVSIKRSNAVPVFVGVYYGKQETRTSKNEIEQEMNMLSAEINEMKNDGEVVVAMDGNGKIGILGEETSRNGKELLHVFEENNLEVVNLSEKCKGKVTRKNTTNTNEFSAIDFVVTSQDAFGWIQEMIVDEEGHMKIKGKSETDHNTILLKMNISDTDQARKLKIADWNLRAGPEKWEQFESEIGQRCVKAREIMGKRDETIDNRYIKWYREIDEAARNMIGKTTFKPDRKETRSKVIKDLYRMKRLKRREICKEANKAKRKALVEKYKQIQDKIVETIRDEKAVIVKQKLEKMIKDKSRNSFWKEKKKLTRNNVHKLQLKTTKVYANFPLIPFGKPQRGITRICIKQSHSPLSRITKKLIIR